MPISSAPKTVPTKTSATDTAPVKRERRRGRTLIDTSLFYDYGPVLSHNAVFNFIVGGRGIGKTYGAKKMAIKNYLKDGAQFIYVRRYKTELKTTTTFFDDIAHEFPEYGFRVQGGEAQLTREPHKEKPVWETIGFFVALSVAQSRKSVAYPDVTLIIFDEFIIEKSNIQYLPSETTIMQNLFSTVDRMQEKTRVLFLANAVSIMNPYFLDYRIKPSDARDGFARYADGFVVAHFPNDAEFMNAVRNTRFGKFVAGTEYDDYATGNVFMDNGNVLIGKKTEDAEYKFTLLTDEGNFSVWYDFAGPVVRVFCQKKRPRRELIFTTSLNRVDGTAIYLPYGDKLLGDLRTSFRYGRMTFDEPETRNALLQVFKR